MNTNNYQFITFKKVDTFRRTFLDTNFNNDRTYQCNTAGKDNDQDKVFKDFAFCDDVRVIPQFYPLLAVVCIFNVAAELNSGKSINVW